MRDPLYNPAPLASPRVFVVRMVTFLAVCACVGVLIWRHLWQTFLANPLLNGLIAMILLAGVLLAVGQVWRLMPEVRWVNAFGGPNLSAKKKLASDVRLLAPMAKMMGDDSERRVISPQTSRSMLEAIGIRLDESREITRYLTGLLVFLGLLGTFWGLTLTIRSVGATIQQLDANTTDLGVAFSALKQGLAAPLDGMSTAFSSSLFGLGGSLVLGFMGLQANQAQARFYTQLEDWLAGLTAIGIDLKGDGDLGLPSPDVRMILAAIEHVGRMGASDRSDTAAERSLEEISVQLRDIAEKIHQDHALMQTWIRNQINEQCDMRRFMEALISRKQFPPRGSA